MPLPHDAPERAGAGARASRTTRLFVIGFAIVEAVVIGWALLSTGPR